MERNEPSADIEITLKKPKNDELLVKGGGSGREPIDTECAVRALNTIAEVSPQWSGAIRFAADRLESQAQEIAELIQSVENAEQIAFDQDIMIKERDAEIFTLTARAEQAEKERDTLISSIERLRTKKIELCSICEFEDLIACCHKNHCEGYQLFKRRGLPQEGEG